MTSAASGVASDVPAELRAKSIGHALVPLLAASCSSAGVHSVFAQAMNLRCGDALIAVARRDGCQGPMTIALATDGASARHDLRLLFAPGEVLALRHHRITGRRAAIDLARAAIWRPPACAALLRPDTVACNLGDAREAIARHRAASRGTAVGLIAGAGAATCSTLEAATRALDVPAMCAALRRLVGWGEGSTPAGDDFIVGWLAALQRLTPGDAPHGTARAGFVAQAALAVSAEANAVPARTADIAAQALVLAARGLHGQALLGCREALLGEPGAAPRAEALALLLQQGASSGADMAQGLLAGLRAWLPPPVQA